MKITGLLFLLIMSITSCSYTSKPPPNCILKLSIFHSGTVILDKDTVSINELDSKLAQKKSSNCELWYYKDLSDGGPPKDSILKILDVLGRIKIPMSFSSKPDFSDEVNIYTGKSKPRKVLHDKK